MTVQIHFLPDEITIDAEPGEAILEVAKRAGIVIPTGCLMGSCHACEVELDDGEESISICACITAVPRGISQFTIHLDEDPVW
jgi:ferredoxin